MRATNCPEAERSVTRRGNLRQSILWNALGVPLASGALCSAIAAINGYVLHSLLGYVTRTNAEIGFVVFTIFGLLAGVHGGWRNAYKLWRVRREEDRQLCSTHTV